MYIVTETKSNKQLQTSFNNNFLADELFSSSYYSPGKNRKRYTEKSCAGGERRKESANRRVTIYQSRNSSVEWLMVD